jgi:hypothetical protein
MAASVINDLHEHASLDSEPSAQGACGIGVATRSRPSTIKLAASLRVWSERSATRKPAHAFRTAASSLSASVDLGLRSKDAPDARIHLAEKRVIQRMSLGKDKCWKILSAVSGKSLALYRKSLALYRQCSGPRVASWTD